MERIKPPIDIDILFGTNKDMQRKVLLDLSYRDIINFCLSDVKKRLNICQTDDFWKSYAIKYNINKLSNRDWRSSIEEAVRGNDNDNSVRLPRWDIRLAPIPKNYQRIEIYKPSPNNKYNLISEPITDEDLNKIIFNYSVTLIIDTSQGRGIVKVEPDNINGITLRNLMDTIFKTFWHIKKDVDLETTDLSILETIDILDKYVIQLDKQQNNWKLISMYVG